MNAKFLTWEQAVEWLKTQPDAQELVKACYYDDPLIVASQRFANSEEWQAVAEILQSWIPGKVLDLGAGNGISSYAFARSGCTVIAIEPDPSSIVGAGAIQQLAQQADLSIVVEQTVAETLPFADGTFDIVYGRQVLHHASNLNQLCREAGRVLRPGGVFLATREHTISQPEDLTVFLKSHPLHHLYGGENAFLLKDYRQAITGAGLNLKLVYGPSDSVINYFPVTRVQNQNKIAIFLEKYVGKFLAHWIGSQKSVVSAMNSCRSLIDKTPGRLYSFLAIKPE
ncbi:class I SAM-dependent methyltransferase [Laspinema sp. A4]|uniref:class I SAM-dependent methyltransferase n=1 Tax=Laspinema sp. D2d TaxID=2953686 RepID=UPI0021BA47F9|nr:class I SAM-dependent methyltransferase [Laspinema sp. D2d]MCT7983615.1 class I SAM-dependent methyltransferase [Laspinema sp. D2d]